MKTKPSYEELAQRVNHLEGELEKHCRAEDQLRKSEHMARALLNATSDAFVLLDKHGIILDTNENHAQRFHKKINEMLGSCVWDLFPPAIAELRKANVERVFKTQKPLHMVDEREGKCNDATICPVFDSRREVTQVAVFVHDITDYKQIEKALRQAHDEMERRIEERTGELVRLNEDLKREIYEREQVENALKASERRLGDIINFLPDATFVIDREGRVLAWNRAIEEMTGIPAGKMLGKSSYEYAIPFYERRRPILIDQVFKSHKVLENGYGFIKRKGDIISAEAFAFTAGKQKRYLYGIASPLYDAQGNIVGAIESIRDVTPYRQAQERLRESGQKYRSLVENIRTSSSRPTGMRRSSMSIPPSRRLRAIRNWRFWDANSGISFRRKSSR